MTQHATMGYCTRCGKFGDLRTTNVTITIELSPDDVGTADTANPPGALSQKGMWCENCRNIDTWASSPPVQRRRKAASDSREYQQTPEYREAVSSAMKAKWEKIKAAIPEDARAELFDSAQEEALPT
jgi:hypothetical protein